MQTIMVGKYTNVFKKTFRDNENIRIKCIYLNNKVEENIVKVPVEGTLKISIIDTYDIRLKCRKITFKPEFKIHFLSFNKTIKNNINSMESLVISEMTNLLKLNDIKEIQIDDNVIFAYTKGKETLLKISF